MLKLPIFGKILSKENAEKEPLLALELSEEKKVKAAVWQVKGEKYKILKKAVKQCKGDWEEAVSQISELVSDLVKEAGLEKKIKKVIFGLPQSFVKEEKIRKPYLTNFKKLCQDLSLTPLGFVEIPQAIALFLKEKESRPQTVILLRVGKSQFSFNVFKIGKEVGSKTVFYKDNIATEFGQVLKELSDIQTFPNRIILYNGEENLEEVKQELLKYPWQKEAGFLHFPRIEILDEDISISALAAAGASEFAQEIAQIPEKGKEEVSSQELGFLKEEDIAEKAELAKQEIQPVVEKKEEKEEKTVKEEKTSVREEREEEAEEEIEIEDDKRPNFFFFLVQSVRSFFSKMPLQPNFKTIIPAFLILALVLGGFLFYLYWVLPQATVKIFVEPYSLEEETEITLNLSPESLDEASEILGKEIEVEKRGSEKMAVASKKDVGEPARGEVTIYNKTTNLKSFSKGTVITGPKKLKFTLDKDVSVASMSDVIAGTPGKEKVKVTASEIGPEGNLGAGSDFTFKDLPIISYAARNEKAFSEGTSREVTVVGKKDQEELLSLLQKKLTNEAKEEFGGQIGPSEELLSETVEGEVVQKKFNHDVDDEASELSLELVMSFKGIAFSKDDLNSLLRKMAEESAPSGYKFEKEEVEMEVTSIEREDDKIVFNAHFKVKLTPEIKEEELKEKLVRKNSKEVDQCLRTVTNISGFEIKFGFQPPLTGKTLPFNPQKISIEIHTL